MYLNKTQLRIVAALFVNYIEDDVDANATAETAGVAIDAVHDLMREVNDIETVADPDEDFEHIKALRAKGYAVVVFGPEDFRSEADMYELRGSLEDVLSERGNIFIGDHGASPVDPDDEDDDDEHQPDEIQEWHDFDPDC